MSGVYFHSTYDTGCAYYDKTKPYARFLAVRALKKAHRRTRRLFQRVLR